MPSVTDALGREVTLQAPARRIVSLVPSETESVCDLVGTDVLAARTEYCEEPAGRIEGVPCVGGTKKFDVEAIRALGPDLVLANKEENGRKLVERLIDLGLTVHVSFPRTVPEALGYLRALAVLLGLDPDRADPLGEAVEAAEKAEQRLRARRARGRASLGVFVPIWVDPWMTFDGRSFASDVLELCGAVNVFLDRPRRYPLAADIGRAPPLSEARVGPRDTRYPRIRLEEVCERAPDVILLPDEPYRFAEAEAQVLRGLDTPASRRGAIRFVSGQDLFWYGTRLRHSLDRLSEDLGTLGDT